MQPDNTKDLASKLSTLSPLIDNIRKAGAILGLSVGVSQNNRVLYNAHFGQRATTSPTPPNTDTIYYVASLTKAVTAAAVALLCEQRLLDWDEPISTYVPEFGGRDDEVGRRANLVDVLSHRTGLAKVSAYWAQRRQRFMMPKHETVNTVVHLKCAAPFRRGFLYNNWGYGLVEAAIEQVTGVSFEEFVRTRFFEPLGLERTTLGIPSEDDGNVTSFNTNLDDGTIYPLRAPPQSDKTGLAAAGAMKASLGDLLKLYQELLSAYKFERDDSNETPQDHSSPPSPFRQVSSLFRPRIPIGNVHISQHAYALGWVCSTLPQRLGTTSMNALYLGANNSPLVGSTAPGTTVLHHHGSLLGTMSCVLLIPELDIVIVVLGNTLGYSDVADWVGQLILQTVIGEMPYDYVGWSDMAKTAHFQQYKDLREKLEGGRTGKPPSQDLQAYCGRYVNSAANFVLDIVSDHDGTGLRMKIQDFEDVVYELLPYSGDTFYWPCDREKEMCEEVMFPWMWEGVHKIDFHVALGGSVDRLSWVLDPTVAAEVFIRKVQEPQLV